LPDRKEAAEVPEVLDLAVPEGEPKSHWHKARGVEVLDYLEQLANAGFGVSNDLLRKYVDHARVRESIADITAALLAGSARK
jgi:hypothetical protein